MAKAPTTKARSTAPKSTAPRSTRKPAAATKDVTPSKSAAKTPVVVTESTPVVSAPSLRKRELVDRAVKRSGLRKKFVKPAVDAFLAELADSLRDDRELTIPPLGKVKIQRSKTLGNAKVMVLKVRVPNAVEDGGPEDGDKVEAETPRIEAAE